MTLIIYESSESTPFVIHHQEPEFGVVRDANYNHSRPSKRYEVKIEHPGYDPRHVGAAGGTVGPGYDYVGQGEAVSLPAGVIMIIEDLDDFLCYH